MERLPREKLDFICFGVLTSLAFIEVCVLAIATCCLFHRENFVSPYECSNVELIYHVCVMRKQMDGTGSPETYTYLSGGAFHLYGKTGEGTVRFYSQNGTGRACSFCTEFVFPVRAWLLQFATTNMAGRNRVFHHGAWY